MSDRFVQDARDVRLAGSGPVTSVRALERRLGVTNRAADVRQKSVQYWIDRQTEPIPERLVRALEEAGYTLRRALA